MVVIAASYSVRHVAALHSQLNHWSLMGRNRKCCVVAFPKSQLGKAPSKSIKPEVLVVNSFPRGETHSSLRCSPPFLADEVVLLLPAG